RTSNPKVAGSSPAGRVTQPTGDKAVTATGELGDKSKNQKLVSGLFSEFNSDPDFLQLIEAWPELPGHIKVAIKALVQTHKAENK
ncbi:MAG: hypothetical protein ACYTGS_09615, partial [Planctomycetota bacterium]